MELEFGGERLTLLPPGGVHLPAHGALFVADLHLGKGAAFRAAGRAIPAGTSAETLKRLSALLAMVPDGTELWVLGDLFHGPSGVTRRLDGRWQRWRAEHPSTGVTLVGGNHDRRLLDVARGWGCRVLSAPVALGRLELRHQPRERGTPDGSDWGLAGHLHPVVRIREGRRSGFRLPCFWLRGLNPAIPAIVLGARSCVTRARGRLPQGVSPGRRPPGGSPRLRVRRGPPWRPGCRHRGYRAGFAIPGR